MGGSDDLGAYAATGRPNGQAPYYALATLASTVVSSSFTLSFVCRLAGSGFSACSSLPFRTQRTGRGYLGTADPWPPIHTIVLRCPAHTTLASFSTPTPRAAR